MNRESVFEAVVEVFSKFLLPFFIFDKWNIKREELCLPDDDYDVFAMGEMELLDVSRQQLQLFC